MFIKSRDETFPWPVIYRTPDASAPGKFVEHEFEAVFKLLPQPEIDALMAKARAAAQVQTSALDIDDEILSKALVGWRDIQLPTGEPFEVNADNRAELLKMPGMRSALVLAFYGTLGGQAQRKNSSPPPSIG